MFLRNWRDRARDGAIELSWEGCSMQNEVPRPFVARLWGS